MFLIVLSFLLAESFPPSNAFITGLLSLVHLALQSRSKNTPTFTPIPPLCIRKHKIKVATVCLVFQELFPEAEKIPSVPFLSTDKLVTFGADMQGATKHMNLDRALFSEVYDAVTDEFFGHCSNRDKGST